MFSRSEEANVNAALFGKGRYSAQRRVPKAIARTILELYSGFLNTG
jgi:hypothetical protein